jgi:hypothetical protein
MHQHSSTPKNPLPDSQGKDNQPGSIEQQKLAAEIRSANEYRHVLKELASYPALTRRQLSIITKIEIATLCRCLFELVHDRKTVVVAYTARCIYTGKRVYHYALASKIQKEGGGECVQS